jgi:error-prone DNA polymerase
MMRFLNPGFICSNSSSFKQVRDLSAARHHGADSATVATTADETGIFNIIVSKDFFEANKLTIERCKFFLVEGKLQSENDVVHVQAKRITQLSNNGLALASHDFH